MVFHWPQMGWMILIAMSFALNLSKQGQPKTGKYGVQYWALGFVIEGGLLWWGGFFS